MLAGLILNGNSFQFNGANYLDMERPWELKWQYRYHLPIFSWSETKPKEWRRYIDDIFSLWDSDEKDVDQFIEQPNKFHPTIKFTVEIQENEI